MKIPLKIIMKIPLKIIMKIPLKIIMKIIKWASPHSLGLPQLRLVVGRGRDCAGIEGGGRQVNLQAIRTNFRVNVF